MYATLAEDLSLVPSTHTRQPTMASNYSSGGYNALFWLPWVPTLIYMYTYADT